MSIFSKLFKNRKVRIYSVRENAFDDRKNLGNDYRKNMLKNSISSHIWRNNQMNDFVNLIQDTLADWVDSVNYLKIYKSYTMKKNDKKIR